MKKPVKSQLKLPIVLHIVLNACLFFDSSHAYEVPKATVKVQKPQGFTVSIPHEPGITLYAFHGKLNGEMTDLSDQAWATDILMPRNGQWIYRNTQQKLQPGDVLYYWTTVRYNGLDYHNYNQKYDVTLADISGGSELQTVATKEKNDPREVPTTTTRATPTPTAARKEIDELGKVLATKLNQTIFVNGSVTFNIFVSK